MRHWLVSLVRRWQQPWGPPQYDAFDPAILTAELGRIQARRVARMHRHVDVPTPRMRTKGGASLDVRVVDPVSK